MKLSFEEKDTINSIINFIVYNFKMSDKDSTNLQNLKKLIKFINENNITNLSFDVCSLLMNRSKLLRNTIKNIYENDELNDIFSNIEDENISNFYNYLKLCVIDSDEFEETDNHNVNDQVREYLRQIGEIPMLSEKEKETLPPLIKQGDEKAINRYVEANLRLVVDVAKKYIRNRQGLTLMDLISEGNLGLIKAVKNYDYDKGFAFSTYAYQSIKNTIIRYIDREYFKLKIGINTTRNVIRLKNTANHLNMVLNINDNEGISKLSKETGFEPSYIKELIKMESTNVASIDESILKDEESSLLVEMIADEETDFDMNIFLKDFIQDFDNSSLTDKYKEVLKLRYGKELTLEEVGQLYHVTRERIRQIEAKALIKARNDKQIRKYKNN